MPQSHNHKHNQKQPQPNPFPRPPAARTEPFWRELNKVIDPELGIGVVDLGLIYDVEIVNTPQRNGKAAKATSSTSTKAKNTSSSSSATTATKATQSASSSTSTTATATVKMTLTSPACPVGPMLVHMVEDATRRALPKIPNVYVEIVWDPAWTQNLIDPEIRDLMMGI